MGSNEKIGDEILTKDKVVDEITDKIADLSTDITQEQKDEIKNQNELQKNIKSILNIISKGGKEIVNKVIIEISLKYNIPVIQIEEWIFGEKPKPGLVKITDEKDGKKSNGEIEQKGKEIFAEFIYSKEKFPNQNDYLKYVSEKFFNPTDIIKINNFLKYFYSYNLIYEKGHNQQYENTFETSDDIWRKPFEILSQINDNGKIWGDCDDIAALFEKLTSLSNKKSFSIGIAGAQAHALAGWFEGETAYIVDTTGDGLGAEALVRQLKRNPGEDDKKLLERLINGFGKKSDVRSEVDMNDINTSFILENGKNFNIPSNFGIAMKYQEIKEFLEKGEYDNVLKIIEEEIIKNPNDINIKLAKLQFYVLLQKPNINECISEINNCIKNNKNQLNRKIVSSNINQTAYFINIKGYKNESVLLFSSALKILNNTFFDINYNDTLSDLLISKEDYIGAYQNDLKIINHLKLIRSSKIDKEYGKYYLDNYGTTGDDKFITPIKNRFHKYKEKIANIDPEFKTMLS